MEAVPDHPLDGPADRAEFRRLGTRAGVELYRASIVRHAFDAHRHDGFGLGCVTHGAQRFRYRGAEHLAPAGALVLMNPGELHTGRLALPLGLPRARGAGGGQRRARLGLRRPRGAPGGGAPAAALAGPQAVMSGPSLSPFHFQRRFKAAHGVTPHQMLMALRLAEAQRRLAAGQAPAERGRPGRPGPPDAALRPHVRRDAGALPAASGYKTARPRRPDTARMTPALLSGTLFALAAGLMWGLVFVGPLWLPEVPAVLHTFGRYLAFGLIALPLAWFDRARLRELSAADWLEALKLAAVGNVAYYLFLSSALQRAGGPLPTMIIGTLPVVIALTTQWRTPPAGTRREAPLAWSRLAPSLLLIAAGLACVNEAEREALRRQQADLASYAWGALLAVGAVACWTWYPIRNAEWLRAHPARRDGHAAGRGRGRPGLPDALRPAAARLHRADGGDRPLRLLARHAVLERGQPAPAALAGRAADRVRNAGGTRLRAAAARPLAVAGHAADCSHRSHSIGIATPCGSAAWRSSVWPARSAGVRSGGPWRSSCGLHTGDIASPNSRGPPTLPTPA
ncbi:AraC family ligand binding domain-containing protein [Piscinibacter sakaiensis]|uniref:AraC family ligand binding domain-containing protein n=1 Tax=Piscinibacter sakaiensis TaxID=1547922 RepID=UPI00372D0426